MFLGGCFASDSTSATPTAISNLSVESLSIQKSVFKEIYVSNKIINTFDGTIPYDWNFDTRLHSKFENNLYGGNVNFTESIVESIKIKKRTLKDTRFQTIFEKPVNTKEDFVVDFIDYLEPIGTIEYAYVPVISGGESNYISNSVESTFDNYFCVDKDVSYSFELDIETGETLNYGAVSVKPIGRKYPITIINGNVGYKSGSMECTFYPYSNSSLSPHEYRHAIYDMLANGCPKILKSFEGEFYMVNIVGDINDSSRQVVIGEHGLITLVKSKFEWIECGNPYDAKELSNNGFINVKSF